jgi:hypothetical protein
MTFTPLSFTTTGVALTDVGGVVDDVGFALDDFEADPEHPVNATATNATSEIPSPTCERRLLRIASPRNVSHQVQ